MDESELEAFEKHNFLWQIVLNKVRAHIDALASGMYFTF
jgi:hypothetical protein